MKKAVLFCIVLISYSRLLAMDGYYLGAGLGGHLTQATQTGSIFGRQTVNGDVIARHNVDFQQNMFSQGTVGLLYAGYGARWCSFLLSGEVFIQLSAATLHSSPLAEFIVNPILPPESYVTAGRVKARVKCCQFGFDLLPGWSLNCMTSIYARVGVSAARTTLGAATNFSFANTRVDLKLNHKRHSAFRLGGGIEHRLSGKCSLRADYIYTDYGKLSAQGVASLARPPNGIWRVESTPSIHLYDHALLLGLAFHYSCQNPLCCKPYCTHCDYEGLYLGGSLGGSALQSNQHGQARTSHPVYTATIKAPSQRFHNQFQGMLFLGCGKVWDPFYVGSELFVSAATNTLMKSRGQAQILATGPAFGASLVYTSFNTSLESSTWQFGLDIRPGFFIRPCALLYARLGISGASMRVRSHAVSISNNPVQNDFFNLSQDVSRNVYKPTFRLGLGLEYQLCSRLHLRADYIYTNFGTISYRKTVPGRDSLGLPFALTNRLASHLANNALLLGLTWYFN